MSRFQVSFAISSLVLACAPTPEPNPAPGPDPVPIAPATPATSSESATESPGTPEAPPSDTHSLMVPTDWTLCDAAADCVLVVTTCCDQCNGGKAIAVNTKHVEETKAMRGNCSGVACTKRGCTTHTNCANGRCVIEGGGIP